MAVVSPVFGVFAYALIVTASQAMLLQPMPSGYYYIAALNSFDRGLRWRDDAMPHGGAARRHQNWRVTIVFRKYRHLRFSRLAPPCNDEQTAEPAVIPNVDLPCQDSKLHQAS